MGIEELPAVKLRGVGDGFWLTLDPSRSEEYLKVRIEKLFKQLRHLTVNARIIIDTGGDQTCDDQTYDNLVNNLGVYLKKTFDVGGVSKPPRKRSVPVERIRQRDLSKGWTNHRSEVLMVRGRVRSGQQIQAKKHIIIMGNVNPGAEISAGGDVIILGRLLGQVHAGVSGNEDVLVFALDFRPTHIQIGQIKAMGGNSGTGAQYASVKDEGIVVQEYLGVDPFGNLPWPQVV